MTSYTAETGKIPLTTFLLADATPYTRQGLDDLTTQVNIYSRPTVNLNPASENFNIDHLVRGKVIHGRYDSYKVLGHLAATGMSKLVMAESEKHGSPIVIKEFLHNGRSRAFEREAYSHNIIYELGGHPNIVSAIDFITLEDDTKLGVFPHVAGETLKCKLLKMSPRAYTPRQIVKEFSEICKAMKHVNDLGIVHRDVKPANIIIAEKPSGSVAKLIDFGVSWHSDIKDFDEEGLLYGTLGYMAPEVAAGTNDPRSDTYSLGIMLFQALSNRLPFEDAGVMALISRHQNDPLPKIPYVTPAVQEVLEIATAKRPEDRYPDAGELDKAFTKAALRK